MHAHARPRSDAAARCPDPWDPRDREPETHAGAPPPIPTAIPSRGARPPERPKRDKRVLCPAGANRRGSLTVRTCAVTRCAFVRRRAASGWRAQSASSAETRALDPTPMSAQGPEPGRPHLAVCKPGRGTRGRAAPSGSRPFRVSCRRRRRGGLAHGPRASPASHPGALRTCAHARRLVVLRTERHEWCDAESRERARPAEPPSLRRRNVQCPAAGESPSEPGACDDPECSPPRCTAGARDQAAQRRTIARGPLGGSRVDPRWMRCDSTADPSVSRET